MIMEHQEHHTQKLSQESGSFRILGCTQHVDLGQQEESVQTVDNGEVAYSWKRTIEARTAS